MPTSLRTSLLAAPLAAALLLLGCGGGNTDEQSVKDTVRNFMVALAHGDGTTACSLATPSAQQKLTAGAPQAGASCAAIIAAISKRLPPQVKQGLESAQVKKATVSGSTATVKDSDITSTSGNLAPFLGGGSTSLQKVGGNWKLSS